MEKPRGYKAQLIHGSLPEIISPYLLKLIQKTGGKDGPIGLQFVAQPDLEKKYYSPNKADPLSEDKYEVAPGLVYKYRGKINKNGQVLFYGRVLWTITRFCASYCRFCTRGREVGLLKNNNLKSKAAITHQRFLSDKQITKVFDFLKNKKAINELIISGGDPLTTPKDYLTKIIGGLAKLQKDQDLSIIRLGTRLPVSNPPAIQPWHYQLLAEIKNPYLMVHINHPAELTKQTIEVLDNFRKISGAAVMSQTVLLKGVNDNVQTLNDLFVKMAEKGIRPYYIYQNDPVYWAKHFTVPVKKAIKLWGRLRPRLSGIAATARFVIDTPYGFGKIPIPEGNAWKVDYKNFWDFRKKKQIL